MSVVKDIVTVNITRETKYPSQAGFGRGAIISAFTPGKLNNQLLGGGLYQLYGGTAEMIEDGWKITDKEYKAAEVYFKQNPNPGSFMVGRRDASAANWTEALVALNSVFSDWYGFDIVSNVRSEILEVASWTETVVKLFGRTTSEKGVIGTQVPLAAGYFQSGTPGVLAVWQAIEDGEFMISKDGAAAVEVDGINMSSSATAGNFVTGILKGKLAAFEAVTTGAIAVTLDAGAAVQITAIDFSGATTFAGLAAILQTAVQGGSGLSGVTVVYDSLSQRFIFTSPNTGATSAVLVASPASGEDLTAEEYMDGGDITQGTAAGLVATMAAVATSLQTAITAAGVSGITVAYTDGRFIFTSGTMGNSSSVEISAVDSGPGTNLFNGAYLNGGISFIGTDLGYTPGVDDLGTVLKALGYDNTVVVYNEKAQDRNGITPGTEEFSFIAWAGNAFSFDPASQTWAFKQLSGITPSSLSSGQEAFAKANNVNVYITLSGVNVTLDGKVIGGEYIDIIRGTHWLEATMQATVFAGLLNKRKIPFNDPGITAIESYVRSVLSEAEVHLLNAEDTTITVPKRSATLPADRAARVLKGVSFTGSYQGAIQKVAIQGTISV